FGKHGLAARSIVNFVEIERIPYRERPQPRPVFLSNRNLEPMYNVGCVLRAFHLVQRRFPDASLVVAGYGSQQAALEALGAELGLAARLARTAYETCLARYVWPAVREEWERLYHELTGLA